MLRPRPYRLIIRTALFLLLPATLRAQAAVEVQATPARLSLKVDGRERLFLSAYDADGNLLTGPAYAFSVSPSGIVRVEEDGTVVGVAPGTARVEVKSGTGKASVAVTVTGTPAPPPPPPKQKPAEKPAQKPQPEPESEPEPVPVLPAGSQLVPTPDSLVLLELERARIDVALRIPGGSGLGQVRVAWVSSDSGVVSVDETGGVLAQKSGRAQLVATGPGGLTATVPVVVRDDSLAVTPGRFVLPVGGMDSARVFVPTQGGRRVTYGLAWRSTDSSVVRVSPDGVVLGSSPGDAFMVMLGYGQQRAVSVSVHPRAARLVISPPPGTPLRLTPGASASISLKALAADSTPIADIGYQWQVGDTTVATIAPVTRRLTGRGIGRTTLTLNTREFEPTVWEVEVVAGGLAIDRTRFRLAPGARDSLAVTVLDTDGHPMGPATGLSFTSDRPEVAAVDSAGVVTAMGIGAATITARSPWGSSATARIYVTESLLLSVRSGAGADLVQLEPVASGTPVPLLADGGMNVQGAWSPDGTRIAFTGMQDGNIDIYVMDADGRNLTRLTDTPGADQEPAWSPDGRTIVFTSLRGGSFQVWAMNADGTGAHALTTGPGSNSSPVFRPDGHRIAFISTRDGNADLFEMGVDGADPRPITRTPEPESHPAYLPDGDLVVVLERSGRSDILRIRAGDGRRTMLVSMPGSVRALALSGDGVTLAFGISLPRDDKNAPPASTLYLKSLAPDLPPQAIRLPGEVFSASFQGTR